MSLDSLLTDMTHVMTASRQTCQPVYNTSLATVHAGGLLTSAAGRQSDRVKPLSDTPAGRLGDRQTPPRGAQSGVFPLKKSAAAQYIVNTAYVTGPPVLQRLLQRANLGFVGENICYLPYSAFVGMV